MKRGCRVSAKWYPCGRDGTFAVLPSDSGTLRIAPNDSSTGRQLWRLASLICRVGSDWYQCGKDRASAEGGELFRGINDDPAG